MSEAVAGDYDSYMPQEGDMSRDELIGFLKSDYDKVCRKVKSNVYRGFRTLEKADDYKGVRENIKQSEKLVQKHYDFFEGLNNFKNPRNKKFIFIHKKRISKLVRNVDKLKSELDKRTIDFDDFFFNELGANLELLLGGKK